MIGNAVESKFTSRHNGLDQNQINFLVETDNPNQVFRNVLCLLARELQMSRDVALYKSVEGSRYQLIELMNCLQNSFAEAYIFKLNIRGAASGDEELCSQLRKTTGAQESYIPPDELVKEFMDRARILVALIHRGVLGKDPVFGHPAFIQMFLEINDNLRICVKKLLEQPQSPNAQIEGEIKELIAQLSAIFSNPSDGIESITSIIELLDLLHSHIYDLNLKNTSSVSTPDQDLPYTDKDDKTFANIFDYKSTVSPQKRLFNLMQKLEFWTDNGQLESLLSDLYIVDFLYHTIANLVQEISPLEAALAAK